MFFHVDLSTSPGSVTLEEPEDCGRFHLAVAGAAPGAEALGRVGETLAAAGIGRLADDQDAWIEVEAVRRLASGRVAEGWTAAFEGMLGYARSKGWTDDAGTAIRAHLEWPG